MCVWSTRLRLIFLAVGSAFLSAVSACLIDRGELPLRKTSDAALDGGIDAKTLAFDGSDALLFDVDARSDGNEVEGLGDGGDAQGLDGPGELDTFDASPNDASLMGDLGSDAFLPSDGGTDGRVDGSLGDASGDAPLGDAQMNAGCIGSFRRVQWVEAFGMSPVSAALSMPPTPGHLLVASAFHEHHDSITVSSPSWGMAVATVEVKGTSKRRLSVFARLAERVDVGAIEVRGHGQLRVLLQEFGRCGDPGPSP
ncbi:MAG: hypothetical protein RMJ84_04310, partial [Sandaracinaceae bacterium]|nr:hypothetical protein [Sandaracinaceae bacterium]